MAVPALAAWPPAARLAELDARDCVGAPAAPPRLSQRHLGAIPVVLVLLFAHSLCAAPICADHKLLWLLLLLLLVAPRCIAGARTAAAANAMMPLPGPRRRAQLPCLAARREGALHDGDACGRLPLPSPGVAFPRRAAAG